jgi:hypothetical protein
MSVRVEAGDVKAIMDNCTVADATVDIFIAAASKVINEVFDSTPDDDSSAVTDSDDYKEIERWFTAHLLASTLSRTTSEEKIGDASVKYTGQWGKNLESTPYGQMVKLLDTSGKMGNLGKQAASIFGVVEFDE